ncbi:MAG: hypothetical protein Q9161_009772 [Pseudevernia consocians]
MALWSDRLEDQPLQPGPAEIDAVQCGSSKYWSYEVYSALSELESGLDFRGFEPRNMLGRVPPLPDRVQYGLLKPPLLSTKWRVTGSKDCDVVGKSLQMPPVPLRLQTSSPITVALSGDSFRKWIEWEGGDQPNLLAVLTLAWSYILSARLVELQGSDVSIWAYTECAAPVHRGDKSPLSGSVDIGAVDSRTVRWFAAILAPGVGFQIALDREQTYSRHGPWAYSLAVHASRFSIECRQGHEDPNISDDTPLTSYQALQSLIDFGNRYGVSSHQLHAALATALLFPTLNHLKVNPALPRFAAGTPKDSPAKLGNEALDRFFNDLPYYITLSCGGDVIISSLCGVFWNPHIPSNLVSPWLQPLLDFKKVKICQSASGRYNEILAVMSARRAPNIAYLSMGAAISGLTSKILEQVLTGQPPLERHAFAWTGVPQSFMDLAGEGEYCETHFSIVYIRRSDCWRLRKLPPTVDDDLHYGVGPFTPWAPPGYALWKNCPLRVQVHRNCERHALAYKGSTWCFSNGFVLEDDLGRDLVIPHISKDRLFEDPDVSHNLQFLDNEDTSIEATRASFRWVLDNGEGMPPEEAYKDAWLLGIGDEDSESDEMSSYDGSSAGGGS